MPQYEMQFYRNEGYTEKVVSAIQFSDEKSMRAFWNELRDIGISSFVRKYNIYRETECKDINNGETVIMRHYPSLYKIKERGRYPYFKTIFDSKDDVPLNERE